jgi:hypothetical protein
MTLVAAIVKADHALVVADSVCCYRDGGIVYQPDGAEFEDIKLVQMPGGFLVSHVGTRVLREFATARAQALPDIDAVIDALPAILRIGCIELGLGEEAGGQTSIAAGWSTKRGHMILAVFQSQSQFTPEIHGSAAAGTLTFWRSPAMPRQPFEQTPDDAKTLIEFAHRCAAHYRALDSTAAIGGRLHLAEISKHATTGRHVADLPMPARRTAVEPCALAESGQIDANAATEVYVSTVSGVTVTGQTGSPFGPVTSVASASFTAPVTCDALVLLAGSASATTASSGTPGLDDFENFRTSLWVNDNGAGSTRLVDTAVYQLDGFLGFSVTRRFQVSYSKRVSLTAGHTYVIEVCAQKLNAGSTVTVDDLEMRVEIIKR